MTLKFKTDLLFFDAPSRNTCHELPRWDFGYFEVFGLLSSGLDKL